MSKDVTGVPETCRSIDEALERIHDTQELLRDFMEQAESQYRALEDAEDYLEEVRSINSELRAFGVAQHERVDDLEDENSQLQDQINDLIDEIDYLERNL